MSWSWGQVAGDRMQGETHGERPKEFSVTLYMRSLRERENTQTVGSGIGLCPIMQLLLCHKTWSGKTSIPHHTHYFLSYSSHFLRHCSSSGKFHHCNESDTQAMSRQCKCSPQNSPTDGFTLCANDKTRFVSEKLWHHSSLFFFCAAVNDSLFIYLTLFCHVKMTTRLSLMFVWVFFPFHRVRHQWHCGHSSTQLRWRGNGETAALYKPPSAKSVDSETTVKAPAVHWCDGWVFSDECWSVDDEQERAGAKPPSRVLLNHHRLKSVRVELMP